VIGRIIIVAAALIMSSGCASVEPAEYNPDSVVPQAFAGTDLDRPPQAGPGEVWCKILIPAVYRDETYEVEEQPATFRQEVIPAKYEMVASAPPPAVKEWRRIECEPNLAPGEELGECWMMVEIQPPAAPPECICVEPERTVCVPVPAVMATRTRQVLVTPERWEWRRVTDCEVQPAVTDEPPAGPLPPTED
jgi:hypothetical protein